MRARIPVTALLVLPMLVLTGCGPDGADPTPSGSSAESASPDPDSRPLDLPDDAVLAVSGVATAANGATADVLVVVHAPAAFDQEAASEAATATVEWCVGEVDESVIAAQSFSFVTVDVSVTATSGSWPGDAQLLVLPVRSEAVGSTLAVSPGLHQVEILGEEGEGAFVPHCLQPAFLDGAGFGSVYLGIPGGDTGWMGHEFGLSALLPADLGTTAVTFSGCAAIITDLAAQYGAPGADWQERFQADLCTIGSPG
jgi:hypothetical protein